MTPINVASDHVGPVSSALIAIPQTLTQVNRTLLQCLREASKRDAIDVKPQETQALTSPTYNTLYVYIYEKYIKYTHYE